MILNIPSATDGHTGINDLFTIVVEDVNKTFMDIVYENDDLTLEEVGILTHFFTGKSIRKPNPEFDEAAFIEAVENGEVYDIPEETFHYMCATITENEDGTFTEELYEPTILEFMNAVQGGTGAMLEYTPLFKAKDSLLPEEKRLITNPDQKFYQVNLPPLEDVIGERSIIYLLGTGKNKPYNTLWRYRRNKEFKKTLRNVPDTIG